MYACKLLIKWDPRYFKRFRLHLYQYRSFIFDILKIQPLKNPENIPFPDIFIFLCNVFMLQFLFCKHVIYIPLYWCYDSNSIAKGSYLLLNITNIFSIVHLLNTLHFLKQAPQCKSLVFNSKCKTSVCVIEKLEFS